ncbi:MAG: MFS transporter, partial [Thermomicrobiaceae bacterium]|nr:MFS transporter [Thermomicrobiaceae bacterium]
MRDYVSQIGRYRREIKLFLLYNLFANIGIGVFQLIYNLYLVQLSLREDFIGQYNALSTLAMACAALVMGVLLGRFGTWRCITYGTVLFLVSSVALSVFATPSLILLFGVLAGAGTSFVFVPVMPFIVEWSRPRIRADVAALTFSLQSLATTVGSLVGGWSPRLAALLLGVAPQSVLAYRLALLAGVALAALALLPMVLMRDARGGHASESAQMPAVTAGGSPARTRVDVAVFVLSGLLLSFGAGAVIPFYNVFLESIGARASQIGMIFSLAGIVAAFAGLFAPRCSRRFGPLGGALILRLAPVPALSRIHI